LVERRGSSLPHQAIEFKLFGRLIRQIGSSCVLGDLTPLYCLSDRSI
jgi:hypothetical protein